MGESTDPESETSVELTQNPRLDDFLAPKFDPHSWRPWKWPAKRDEGYRALIVNPLRNRMALATDVEAGRQRTGFRSA